MFVRGSYVWSGWYLDSAGDRGYYWSSIGRMSSTAYYLHFNSLVVYPSYGYVNRYNGFSVRCVALGG